MRTKYARRIRLIILVARYDIAQNTSFAESIKQPNGIGKNLSEAIAVFEGKEEVPANSFYGKIYFKSYKNYKKYFEPRATANDRLKMMVKINDFHRKVLTKEIEKVEKELKDFERKIVKRNK